MLIAFTKIA